MSSSLWFQAHRLNRCSRKSDIRDIDKSLLIPTSDNTFLMVAVELNRNITRHRGAVVSGRHTARRLFAPTPPGTRSPARSSPSQEHQHCPKSSTPCPTRRRTTVGHPPARTIRGTSDRRSPRLLGDRTRRAAQSPKRRGTLARRPKGLRRVHYGDRRRARALRDKLSHEARGNGLPVSGTEIAGT